MHDFLQRHAIPGDGKASGERAVRGFLSSKGVETEPASLFEASGSVFDAARGAIFLNFMSVSSTMQPTKTAYGFLHLLDGGFHARQVFKALFYVGGFARLRGNLGL